MNPYLSFFFLSGKPKGAMLTHGNIIANTAAFLKLTEVNKPSKILNLCKHPLNKTSRLSRRDEQSGQQYKHLDYDIIYRNI